MRIEKAKIRTSTMESLKVDKQGKNTAIHRVSAYTEAYKGEYYNIEVSKLVPYKNQSRKSFDQKSLEELASTIKEHGIRQPLTILPSSEQEGKYEIISGERRWRAAKIVGLNRVPCIIINNDEAAEEIALIENIQRENLHPLELMHAFQNLLDRKICNSTQEIATKLGISKSTVVEILALSNLPARTQEMLLNEGIKARKVLRTLGKSAEDKHLSIINDYKNNVEKQDNSKTAKTAKSKILSVYFDDGKILVRVNKISGLSKGEKVKLRDSLNDLVNSIKI